MRSVLILVGGIILGGLVVLALMASGVLDRILHREPSGKWGTFSGTPKAELLDEGRVLRLLEDYWYIDPNNKVWLAPKGSLVDGASIPQIFWSLVGGPLEGKYRDASIIHDVACVEKKEDWEAVHFMFYEACLCGGLGEYQAKTLYWAVYQGGPRWQHVQETVEKSAQGPTGKTFKYSHAVIKAVPVSREPKITVNDLKEVQKLIEQKNPSLEELRSIQPKGH